MSLKAFHVVFITAASALAFGTGIWALKEFVGSHSALELTGGIFGIVAAAGLLVYERYFLKKLKNVSYL